MYCHKEDSKLSNEKDQLYAVEIKLLYGQNW